LKQPPKKKILLLTTGGTIASGPTKEGLAPILDGDSLLRLLGPVSERYDITVRDILSLDSSNIQPEEWRLIARSAASAFLSNEGFDGIVITHGTDTMAYTASILSFMLRNPTMPVVITGSQLPIFHPLTDALENLRTAFAMAASGIRGVFVAFNRKIILGTRAVKVRTTGFDAFESVNSPCAALVDGGGLRVNYDIIPPVAGAFSLEDHICGNVFLLKLVPGLDPRIFDALEKMDYRGIVIEAFGMGGLHFIRRDLISKLQMTAEQGITVVVCSQCLYERSDFSIYQTGQKALEQGVLQGFDMTTEAAVTKLMWALGKAEDQKEVRKLFSRSFFGEVVI
jgi:L-asparaginase